jgi:hypothetical protein
MADNIERRKTTFKTKQLNSTERIRKQSEQVRKEKRTANVLAKRLKTDTNAVTEREEYTEIHIREALQAVMVMN